MEDVRVVELESPWVGLRMKLTFWWSRLKMKSIGKAWVLPRLDSCHCVGLVLFSSGCETGENCMEAQENRAK